MKNILITFQGNKKIFMLLYFQKLPLSTFMAASPPHHQDSCPRWPNILHGWNANTTTTPDTRGPRVHINNLYTTSKSTTTRNCTNTNTQYHMGDTKKFDLRAAAPFASNRFNTQYMAESPAIQTWLRPHWQPSCKLDLGGNYNNWKMLLSVLKQENSFYSGSLGVVVGLVEMLSI